MSPKKPKMPKFSVGSVKVRAARGPDDQGRYYWRAVLYRDRKEHTLWTGWETRAGAEATVAKMVAGGEQHDTRPRRQRVSTVDDLIGRWIPVLRRRGDLRPSTIVDYKATTRHLRRLIGTHALQRLDLATLDEYVAVRRREGAATNTIRKEIKRIGSAWEWGRRIGMAPDRRLDVPRLRAQGVRDRYTPSPAEVGQVLEHIRGGWPSVVVALLFATGCRIDEIASLTWGDADLLRGWLRVDGKTGAREVPIGGATLATLRRWSVALARDRDIGVRIDRGSEVRYSSWPSGWVHHDDEMLFHGCSRYFVRTKTRLHLQEACDAAGVPYFSPHGLRRAAVDRLARSGVDIGTAASILGHSPKVMLEHYRQVSNQDRRKAIREARLGEVPEGKIIPFGKNRG